MKKKAAFFLITTLIFVCACGTEKENLDSVDVSSIEELETLDNSIDPYSSILNELVEIDEPEGAIEGGNEADFVAGNKAFRFKIHVLEDYEDSYDEISIVDSYGVKKNIHLAPSTLLQIGYAYDFDGFLALSVNVEDNIYHYYLIKYYSDGTVAETIELPFLDGDSFNTYYFSLDISGNILLIGSFYSNSESYSNIYVIDEQGNLILEEIVDNLFYRFKYLKDGRLAMVFSPLLDESETFAYYCYSKEKNSIDVLCEYDSKYGYWGINYYDSETYITADFEGVFLRDSNMEVKEKLYSWKNHGIIVSNVQDVACFDDKIEILYENQAGLHYLVLQPTENVVEVQKIKLAVPQWNSSKYTSAVYQFNSTHPSCVIEIADDYDETSLITEISSGKGPVLISSELVDFDGNVNFWEPLDDVYEQLGIKDELNEAAIKLGSINGKLYGIVTDFAIETMVTGCENSNWNYEQFISEIKADGIESIGGSGYDEASVATFIFDHGIDDSYYINPDTKETLFDTDEFRSLMLLIKEKAYKENDDSFEEERIHDGKDLCTSIYVKKPEELILYNKLYGEGVNITGFPGNDGPVNFLSSMSTIAIRRNASKEEKEIAYAFAKELLSYDAQRSLAEDVSSGMSVRKDVFEERINAVKKGTKAYVGIRGEMEIDETPDNAANQVLLEKMISTSVPISFGDDQYKGILFEEFKSYFSDSITLDMLIDNLSSRVGIYIKEHQ